RRASPAVTSSTACASRRPALSARAPGTPSTVTSAGRASTSWPPRSSRSPMTPGELEALVAKGTAGDVLQATRKLSEQERRALAATALRLAQHYAREEAAAVRDYWAAPRHPDESARAGEDAHRERVAVAGAALLAVGSPSDLARHDRALWDRDR